MKKIHVNDFLYLYSIMTSKGLSIFSILNNNDDNKYDIRNI